MQFHIKTMTCGGCARAVARMIRSVTPAAEAQADPPARAVKVKTTAPREALAAAPAKAGVAAAEAGAGPPTRHNLATRSRARPKPTGPAHPERQGAADHTRDSGAAAFPATERSGMNWPFRLVFKTFALYRRHR